METVQESCSTCDDDRQTVVPPVRPEVPDPTEHAPSCSHPALHHTDLPTVLCYGDIVFLSPMCVKHAASGETTVKHNVVCCDGFVDDKVYTLSLDAAANTGPTLPTGLLCTQRDGMFEICRKFTYEHTREEVAPMHEFQPRPSPSASPSPPAARKPHQLSEAEEAKASAEEEWLANLAEQREARARGRDPVKFGDRVQLRHVMSARFLTASGSSSEGDAAAGKPQDVCTLALSHYGSRRSWFKLVSADPQRAPSTRRLSDAIPINALVAIEGASRQFLVPSKGRRHHGVASLGNTAVGETVLYPVGSPRDALVRLVLYDRPAALPGSPHPDESASAGAGELAADPDAFQDGKAIEPRLAALRAAVAAHRALVAAVPRCGAALQFIHGLTGDALTYSPKLGVHMAPPSPMSWWCLEAPGRLAAGGPVAAGRPYRLRHFFTRLYLSVSLPHTAADAAAAFTSTSHFPPFSAAFGGSDEVVRLPTSAGDPPPNPDGSSPTAWPHTQPVLMAVRRGRMAVEVMLEGESTSETLLGSASGMHADTYLESTFVGTWRDGVGDAPVSLVQPDAGVRLLYRAGSTPEGHSTWRYLPLDWTAPRAPRGGRAAKKRYAASGGAPSPPTADRAATLFRDDGMFTMHLVPRRAVHHAAGLSSAVRLLRMGVIGHLSQALPLTITPATRLDRVLSILRQLIQSPLFPSALPATPGEGQPAVGAAPTCSILQQVAEQPGLLDDLVRVLQYPFQHSHNRSCDACGVSPIVGTAYACFIDGCGVNLCELCKADKYRRMAPHPCCPPRSYVRVFPPSVVHWDVGCAVCPIQHVTGPLFIPLTRSTPVDPSWASSPAPPPPSSRRRRRRSVVMDNGGELFRGHPVCGQCRQLVHAATTELDGLAAASAAATDALNAEYNALEDEYDAALQAWLPEGEVADAAACSRFDAHLLQAGTPLAKVSKFQAARERQAVTTLEYRLVDSQRQVKEAHVRKCLEVFWGNTASSVASAGMLADQTARALEAMNTLVDAPGWLVKYSQHLEGDEEAAEALRARGPALARSPSATAASPLPSRPGPALRRATTTLMSASYKGPWGPVPVPVADSEMLHAEQIIPEKCDHCGRKPVFTKCFRCTECSTYGIKAHLCVECFPRTDHARLHVFEELTSDGLAGAVGAGDMTPDEESSLDLDDGPSDSNVWRGTSDTLPHLFRVTAQPVAFTARLHRACAQLFDLLPRFSNRRSHCIRLRHILAVEAHVGRRLVQQTEEAEDTDGRVVSGVVPSVLGAPTVGVGGTFGSKALSAVRGNRRNAARALLELLRQRPPHALLPRSMVQMFVSLVQSASDNNARVLKPVQLLTWNRSTSGRQYLPSVQCTIATVLARQPHLLPCTWFDAREHAIMVTLGPDPGASPLFDPRQGHGKRQLAEFSLCSGPSANAGLSYYLQMLGLYHHICAGGNRFCIRTVKGLQEWGLPSADDVRVSHSACSNLSLECLMVAVNSDENQVVTQHQALPWGLRAQFLRLLWVLHLDPSREVQTPLSATPVDDPWMARSATMDTQSAPTEGGDVLTMEQARRVLLVDVPRLLKNMALGPMLDFAGPSPRRLGSSYVAVDADDDGTTPGVPECAPEPKFPVEVAVEAEEGVSAPAVATPPTALRAPAGDGKPPGIPSPGATQPRGPPPGIPSPNATPPRPSPTGHRRSSSGSAVRVSLRAPPPSSPGSPLTPKPRGGASVVLGSSHTAPPMGRRSSPNFQTASPKAPPKLPSPSPPPPPPQPPQPRPKSTRGALSTDLKLELGLVAALHKRRQHSGHHLTDDADLRSPGRRPATRKPPHTRGVRKMRASTKPAFFPTAHALRKTRARLRPTPRRSAGAPAAAGAPGGRAAPPPPPPRLQPSVTAPAGASRYSPPSAASSNAFNYHRFGFDAGSGLDFLEVLLLSCERIVCWHQPQPRPQGGVLPPITSPVYSKPQLVGLLDILLDVGDALIKLRYADTRHASAVDASFNVAVNASPAAGDHHSSPAALRPSQVASSPRGSRPKPRRQSVLGSVAGSSAEVFGGRSLPPGMKGFTSVSDVFASKSPSKSATDHAAYQHGVAAAIGAVLKAKTQLCHTITAVLSQFKSLQQLRAAATDPAVGVGTTDRLRALRAGVTGINHVGPSLVKAPLAPSPPATPAPPDAIKGGRGGKVTPPRRRSRWPWRKAAKEAEDAHATRRCFPTKGRAKDDTGVVLSSHTRLRLLSVTALGHGVTPTGRFLRRSASSSTVVSTLEEPGYRRVGRLLAMLLVLVQLPRVEQGASRALSCLGRMLVQASGGPGAGLSPTTPRSNTASAAEFSKAATPALSESKADAAGDGVATPAAMVPVPRRRGRMVALLRAVSNKVVKRLRRRAPHLQINTAMQPEPGSGAAVVPHVGHPSGLYRIVSALEDVRDLGLGLNVSRLRPTRKPPGGGDEDDGALPDSGDHLDAAMRLLQCLAYYCEGEGTVRAPSLAAAGSGDVDARFEGPPGTASLYAFYRGNRLHVRQIRHGMQAEARQHLPMDAVCLLGQYRAQCTRTYPSKLRLQTYFLCARGVSCPQKRAADEARMRARALRVVGVPVVSPAGDAHDNGHSDVGFCECCRALCHAECRDVRVSAVWQVRRRLAVCSCQHLHTPAGCLHPVVLPSQLPDATPAPTPHTVSQRQQHARSCRALSVVVGVMRQVGEKLTQLAVDETETKGDAMHFMASAQQRAFSALDADNDHKISYAEARQYFLEQHPLSGGEYEYIAQCLRMKAFQPPPAGADDGGVTWRVCSMTRAQVRDTIAGRCGSPRWTTCPVHRGDKCDAVRRVVKARFGRMYRKRITEDTLNHILTSTADTFYRVVGRADAWMMELDEDHDHVVTQAEFSRETEHNAVGPMQIKLLQTAQAGMDFLEAFCKGNPLTTAEVVPHVEELWATLGSSRMAEEDTPQWQGAAGLGLGLGVTQGLEETTRGVRYASYRLGVERVLLAVYAANPGLCATVSDARVKALVRITLATKQASHARLLLAAVKGARLVRLSATAAAGLLPAGRADGGTDADADSAAGEGDAGTDPMVSEVMALMRRRVATGEAVLDGEESPFACFVTLLKVLAVCCGGSRSPGSKADARAGGSLDAVTMCREGVHWSSLTRLVERLDAEQQASVAGEAVSPGSLYTIARGAIELTCMPGASERFKADVDAMCLQVTTGALELLCTAYVGTGPAAPTVCLEEQPVLWWLLSLMDTCCHRERATACGSLDEDGFGGLGDVEEVSDDDDGAESKATATPPPTPAPPAGVPRRTLLCQDVLPFLLRALEGLPQPPQLLASPLPAMYEALLHRVVVACDVCPRHAALQDPTPLLADVRSRVSRLIDMHRVLASRTPASPRAWPQGTPPPSADSDDDDDADFVVRSQSNLVRTSSSVQAAQRRTACLTPPKCLRDVADAAGRVHLGPQGPQPHALFLVSQALAAGVVHQVPGDAAAATTHAHRLLALGMSDSLMPSPAPPLPVPAAGLRGTAFLVVQALRQSFASLGFEADLASTQTTVATEVSSAMMVPMSTSAAIEAGFRMALHNTVNAFNPMGRLAVDFTVAAWREWLAAAPGKDGRRRSTGAPATKAPSAESLAAFTADLDSLQRSCQEYVTRIVVRPPVDAVESTVEDRNPHRRALVVTLRALSTVVETLYQGTVFASTRRAARADVGAETATHGDATPLSGGRVQEEEEDDGREEAVSFLEGVTLLLDAGLMETLVTVLCQAAQPKQGEDVDTVEGKLLTGLTCVQLLCQLLPQGARFREVQALAKARLQQAVARLCPGDAPAPPPWKRPGAPDSLHAPCVPFPMALCRLLDMLISPMVSEEWLAADTGRDSARQLDPRYLTNLITTNVAHNVQVVLSCVQRCSVQPRALRISMTPTLLRCTTLLYRLRRPLAALLTQKRSQGGDVDATPAALHTVDSVRTLSDAVKEGDRDSLPLSGKELKRALPLVTSVVRQTLATLWSLLTEHAPHEVGGDHSGAGFSETDHGGRSTCVVHQVMLLESTRFRDTLIALTLLLTGSTGNPEEEQDLRLRMWLWGLLDAMTSGDVMRAQPRLVLDFFTKERRLKRLQTNTSLLHVLERALSRWFDGYVVHFHFTNTGLDSLAAGKAAREYLWSHLALYRMLGRIKMLQQRLTYSDSGWKKVVEAESQLAHPLLTRFSRDGHHTYEMAYTFLTRHSVRLMRFFMKRSKHTQVQVQFNGKLYRLWFAIPQSCLVLKRARNPQIKKLLNEMMSSMPVGHQDAKMSRFMSYADLYTRMVFHEMSLPIPHYPVTVGTVMDTVWRMWKSCGGTRNRRGFEWNDSKAGKAELGALGGMPTTPAHLTPSPQPMPVLDAATSNAGVSQTQVEARRIGKAITKVGPNGGLPMALLGGGASSTQLQPINTGWFSWMRTTVDDPSGRFFRSRRAPVKSTCDKMAALLAIALWKFLKLCFAVAEAGELVSVAIMVCLNAILVVSLEWQLDADTGEELDTVFAGNFHAKDVLRVLGFLHLVLAVNDLIVYVVHWQDIFHRSGLDQFHHKVLRKTKRRRNVAYFVLGANPTNLRHKLVHVFWRPLPLLKLWSVCFGVLGLLLSPVYYAYLVLTATPRVRLLTYVLQVVREKSGALMAALLGGFLVLYGFAVGTFINFREQYEFPDLELNCDTLLKCVLSHWDYGFRTAPSWPGIGTFSTAHDFEVFFFNSVYQVFVILILTAVVSGIVIDSFSQRREEDDLRRKERANRCFICGLSRADFEDSGGGANFDDHVLEHDLRSYLYFRVYLEQKVASNDLDPIERYAYQCFNRRDPRIFPRASHKV